MAKRKSVKRTKKTARRVVHKKAASYQRLNILLLILTLSVLILAAVMLTSGGI